MLTRSVQNLLNQVKVATLEDIKAGNILWHVYGFPDRQPTKLRLITGPVPIGVVCAHTNEPLGSYSDFTVEWIITEEIRELYTYKSYRSLHDCGIGASYNGNRLFSDEGEAWKYVSLLNS